MSRRTIALLVAVVLVATGFAVSILWPKGDSRAGSMEVRNGTVGMPSAAPRTYRITYRDTQDETVTTRAVIVRRPFDAAVDLRTSSHTRSEEVWSFGRHETNAQVQFWAPGVVPPDVRPDVVLPDAIRKHLAAAREVRKVAGRLCRVYRVANASNAQPLRTVHADATTFRDLCIDGDGLVLEEVVLRDGRLVRRTIATGVTINPPIDPGLFDTGDNLLGPEQAGSLQRLAPTSRLPGDRFFELSRRPHGFKKGGRFAVVPPGQPGLGDPRSRSKVVAFLSEVWTKGLDVVTVDQGGPSAGRAFAPDAGAIHVHIDRLGSGEALYGLQTNEVRFAVGGSRFVRIRGTLPMEQLLDMARSLREHRGGPLVGADRAE